MLAKISAPAAFVRLLRLSGSHVGCLNALVKRGYVLAACPPPIKPKSALASRSQHATLFALAALQGRC
ncbi:MAG: hypothetical protein NBV68_16625 [Erythrobacter sp.]|uniref:hypothetical protein n=1 Tax=Erythrobacter sp. TaxID=1042 RepID=UPI0025EE28DC|nr:hypothetical protein [Erythrobacter sp.]MCM0001002.1 hypothetical protein [Erythrobacter sp.]